MKVLHLARTDLDGGAARAAYRLHRALRDQGVDSQMLVGLKLSDDPTVLGPQGLVGKAWARVAPFVDAVPTRFLKTSNSTLHSPAWVGTAGVTRRAREWKPDIIQLHWVCGGFLRPEALRYFGDVPLVWRLADMWAFSGSEHYVRDSKRYEVGYHRGNRPPYESGFDLDRWVWKRKRRAWKEIKNLTIVCPSRWMAECARHSALFGERRVEVIATGQDPSRFKPVDRRFAREFLGLPVDKKLILFSSLSPNRDPRKGMGLLEGALRSFKETHRGEDVELVVVGLSQAGAIADAVGIDQSPALFGGVRTHFVGRLHDEISLALVYSAADVFVAPSTEDNLPNSVIEAMACGVPAVAFAIGGMPDLIDHQKNGYLAKPFDVPDLASGLEWVLRAGVAGATERSAEGAEVGAPSGAMRLSRAAREKIESQFTLELQAQSYCALYEDLLKSKAQI